jgi:hypothetical protein
MRWRSTQDLDIDGHAAVVRTEPSRSLSPYFRITLEVDGVPVAPEPGASRWER